MADTGFRLDLVTHKVTNYSNAPGQYDEPEGIFPDGGHTLVECVSELKTQGTTRIALAASSEEAGILADALGVKPLRQDLPAQSYSGHFSHAGKK